MGTLLFLASSSPRVVNSRRLRGTGYLVRIGKVKTVYRICIEVLKERDHTENLHVHGSIILKCICDKYVRIKT